MSDDGPQPKGSSNRKIWVMIGSVIVGVSLLIGGNQLMGRQESASVMANQADTARRAVRGQMGNPAAQVQILEYGDYL